MSVECVRHLNVRIGEHISISPLLKNLVKPKNSSEADYLLFCNHPVSYDDFSFLTREQNLLGRTEREHIKNEKSTVFEEEHYIGTIAPMRHLLVLRVFLELCLFLVAATLFLLNKFLLFSYLEVYENTVIKSGPV